MIAQDVASENAVARHSRPFDYQSPDEVCNVTLETAMTMPLRVGNRTANL
jgi:hypothetical protein